MSDNKVIRIDVEQVLKERLPRLSKLVPRFAVNWLKKTICQDELNALLEENKGLEGAEFCRGILKSLNITVNTVNENRLPPADQRRVIIVSNHPLGGLDGMALIDLFQRYYGGQVWFIVNDLLLAVKPLESVFLPMNKFGKQSRSASRRLDEVMKGDDPVLIFPAGLVSRRRKVPIEGERRRKMVVDLDWKKTFVTKAVEYKRDVIPIFFQGENTSHFYKMANLRKNLGLKFNFEMVYLPGELIKARGKEFTVFFGSPIPWQSLEGGKAASGFARSIGSLIYGLPSQAIAEAADNEDSNDSHDETEVCRFIN